jgi:hypothetical protein
MRRDGEFLSGYFIGMLLGWFDDKVCGIQVLEAKENGDFTVQFHLYESFAVRVIHEEGEEEDAQTYTFLQNGDLSIQLSVGIAGNLELNLERYMKTLDEEMRLRLPDKLLIQKGW